MPQLVFEVIRKPLETRIREAACVYWDVEPDFFRTKDKTPDNAQRRHILFYLLVRIAEENITEVAKQFGIAYPSVFEAVEKIEVRKDVYRKVSEAIKQIQLIAESLDARLVTVGITLHTKESNNENDL